MHRNRTWWKPWTWAPIEWRIVSEPEWDGSQLLRMQGRAWWRNTTGLHGQPMSEATSPLADPANPDAEFRYVVDGPWVDYAEQALAKKKHDFYENQPDTRPRGADTWRVRRETTPRR